MKVLVRRNRMKVALFMLNLLILCDKIDMSDLNDATNPGLILGQPIKTIVNHRGDSFRNKQTRVNKSNLIAIAPITVLKACSNRIDVGYKQNRFIICVNKTNLVQIKRVSSRNFTSLALINARSLKANSKIINDFILDKNTPIVAFTETWIKNNNSNICIKDITPDHSVFLQVDRPARLEEVWHSCVLKQQIRNCANGLPHQQWKLCLSNYLLIEATSKYVSYTALRHRIIRYFLKNSRKLHTTKRIISSVYHTWWSKHTRGQLRKPKRPQVFRHFGQFQSFTTCFFGDTYWWSHPRFNHNIGLWQCAQRHTLR